MQGEFPAMASWVKCTDLKAQTVWLNLDNVTVMTWRDTPQDTEIIFIGEGQVIVRERSENNVSRRRTRELLQIFFQYEKH